MVKHTQIAGGYARQAASVELLARSARRVLHLREAQAPLVHGLLNGLDRFHVSLEQARLIGSGSIDCQGTLEGISLLGVETGVKDRLQLVGQSLADVCGS